MIINPKRRHKAVRIIMAVLPGTAFSYLEEKDINILLHWKSMNSETLPDLSERKR